MTSPKSHNVGGEFDHLVAYSMACTLESEDVSAMEYGKMCFGSLDEVIKVEDLVCFNEGKRVLEDGFWMCLE